MIITDDLVKSLMKSMGKPNDFSLSVLSGCTSSTCESGCAIYCSMSCSGVCTPGCTSHCHTVGMNVMGRIQ